jgi:DnaK suppressor protein
MTTSEFDKHQITIRLEEARQEIAKDLGLRDEVYIEPAADELDEAQAAEARELATRSLERSARTLRQIEKALRRLNKDEYGICASCDKPIGAKRIQAVPWADLCLNCQELADRTESSDGPDLATELLMTAT